MKKIITILLIVITTTALSQSDTTFLGIEPSKFQPPFHNPQYTTIKLPENQISIPILGLYILIISIIITAEQIYKNRVLQLFLNFFFWDKFKSYLNNPTTLLLKLERVLFFLSYLIFPAFAYNLSQIIFQKINWLFILSLFLGFVILTIWNISFTIIAGKLLDLQELSLKTLKINKYFIILNVPIGTILNLLAFMNINLGKIILSFNFFVIIIILIVKYIRQFQLFKELGFSNLLLILYLCTAEVLPVIILAKLLTF